jgi:uncharacterized membrane protein YkoI
MMDRRLFLFALLGLLSAGGLPAGVAMAKDGKDSDDDSDDSDSDDDNSGSGGSDDDSDDSDRDSDDDDDDDSRGRGGDDDESDDSSGRGSGKDRDHLKAREAVDKGRILPLREILKRVDDLGGGRVIAVDLNLKARAPYYTLKVESGSRVKTLKLEAATGRKLNIFGW